DLEYHSAVKSLWDNLVNKKIYVTGGVGSGDTAEGFGVNYALSNQAYCEACSSCSPRHHGSYSQADGVYQRSAQLPPACHAAKQTHLVRPLFPRAFRVAV